MKRPVVRIYPIIENCEISRQCCLLHRTSHEHLSRWAANLSTVYLLVVWVSYRQHELDSLMPSYDSHNQRTDFPESGFTFRSRVVACGGQISKNVCYWNTYEIYNGVNRRWVAVCYQEWWSFTRICGEGGWGRKKGGEDNGDPHHWNFYACVIRSIDSTYVPISSFDACSPTRYTHTRAHGSPNIHPASRGFGQQEISSICYT